MTAHVIACPTCQATWRGLHICHASCCHRTFSSPSAFDRHQRVGECVPPETRGLVHIDGIWRYPGRRDVQEWNQPTAA